MPYIFRKNGDEIESHAVKEVDYNVQIVDQIVVSKELLGSSPIDSHGASEIYHIGEDAGNIKVSSKNGYAVGVGEFGIGKFLYSDGFGPCQLVIATLSDGSFAVYHAFAPNSPATTAFLEAIKDRVTSIAIFEKTFEGVNLQPGAYEKRKAQSDWKGDELNKIINREIKEWGSNIKVMHLLVPEYYGVVADANAGKFYISSEASSKPENQLTGILQANQEANVTSVGKRKSHSGSGVVIKEEQPFRMGRQAEGQRQEEITVNDNGKVSKDSLVDVINNHVRELKGKKFMGMHAYNTGKKSTEIERALARASNRFQSDAKVNFDEFMDYKEAGARFSLAEALQMSRYQGAKSHMYAKIRDEVASESTAAARGKVSMKG